MTLHFYIEVNGEPSCQSELTLSEAFREHPTRCAWETRAEADKEADRIAAKVDVPVFVREGRCPRGGDDDRYED